MIFGSEEMQHFSPFLKTESTSE